MNLLESLQEEIKTNIKIICLTPYDRDYEYKFLFKLWTTGFVEEFEYTFN